jgi:hypothetical protein
MLAFVVEKGVSTRHTVNYHQILEPSSPYYIQPRLHLFRLYFAMTSTLIPIPENAEFWCNKLFYLHTPIVLTAEEFDTYWPLISQST